MKKLIRRLFKKKKGLLSHKVNFIVDERLNNIKLESLAPCKYPERLIYFRGSTVHRTRLYRMAVGLNLEELSKSFEIFAEMEESNDILPFCKNMIINAFLVKRKNA